MESNDEEGDTRFSIKRLFKRGSKNAVCPACKQENESGSTICTHCGLYMRPLKSYLGVDKSSYPETATCVRIPGYISKIDECAFINREALKTVLIDRYSRLEAIGNSAFSGSGISLRIHVNVKRIGGFAFSACESLKTVETDPGSRLKTIGTSAFIVQRH